MNKIIVSSIKTFRTLLTFWIAEYSTKHLENTRTFEACKALNFLPEVGSQDMVEIGGGAGWQNDFFTSVGFNITSYDVIESNYREIQNGAVELYDGHKIPRLDGSIDIIFSSNTLEHIPHIDECLRDHMRVLSNEGVCLHILPSPSWRFWSSVTDLIKKFYLTPPHGEFSSTVFHEFFDFSQRAWRQRFEQAGFEVVEIKEGGLFYTANAILSYRVSIRLRSILARFLGSSCNYYVLKKPTAKNSYYMSQNGG